VFPLFPDLVVARRIPRAVKRIVGIGALIYPHHNHPGDLAHRVMTDTRRDDRLDHRNAAVR